MNTDVMFSSATDVWATPQDLFDDLHAVYGFTLDVCALPENAKCARFFSPKDDGLAQDWAPATCWMNPPYGRTIGKWVKKAWDESRRGATVVCLLPSRTDTKWFHDYCMRGDVTFMRGRLKFGDAKNSAPFPSILVRFSPEHV
jgi:site-specific DNA-methyltransferase (adenine-specific)